jgi:hypothetical protein
MCDSDEFVATTRYKEHLRDVLDVHEFTQFAFILRSLGTLLLPS